MSLNDEGGALGGTFVTHRAQLRAVAEGILGCRQRADDVVQDAYLKITDTASIFNTTQPLAYLYQVVRNLAIDRYRRTSFERGVFTVEEAGSQMPNIAYSPETIAINCQELNLVAKALAELPDRTRQAFELYRLKGYTQREVATKLGVSATLVNFMIRDAMDHCRSVLCLSEYS